MNHIKMFLGTFVEMVKRGLAAILGLATGITLSIVVRSAEYATVWGAIVSGIYAFVIFSLILFTLFTILILIFRKIRSRRA